MQKIFKSLINNKIFKYSSLIIILLLGFLIRLYKIDSPITDWHSFRQADTSSVSKLYVQNGINFLFPKYHDVSTTQSGLFNPEGYRFVEFPVYNALVAFLFKNLSIFTIEVWGRLVSIVSALISSFFIYLITKKYINYAISFLAMSTYLLMPFNIYFSRVILPEPLAITFGLIGVWFFIRYKEGDRFIYFLLSSFFMSLAILVKPYMIFYALPIILLIFARNGFRKAVLDKKYYIYAVLVILPFILWRFWMSQFPEGIPFWKWTFNGDGIRFKPAFWKWIFGERLTKLMLGYLGIIPFYYGLLKLKRNQFILTGFLLGALLYVFTFATANVKHDYYQTLIVPAVSMITAYGIYYMWLGSGNNSLKEKLLLLLFLIVGLFSSTSEIKEFYKINRPEIVAAGNKIKEITPSDALVIAPYYGDTAFLYQTGRRGWPVVDRPINELIEKGAKYFVSVDLNHYQTVEFENTFKTIAKTDNYIVLDLTNKKI